MITKILPISARSVRLRMAMVISDLTCHEHTLVATHFECVVHMHNADARKRIAVLPLAGYADAAYLGFSRLSLALINLMKPEVWSPVQERIERTLAEQGYKVEWV